MNTFEWTALIALSVLWGGSFFFNAVAVREVPPLTLVLCRVALAALALSLIGRMMGQTPVRERRAWRAFFIMGALNNVVPFSLIVWGQVYVASGVASILNATTPLFTVMVAHAMTSDERLTAPRLIGVVVGLIGVATMIGEDAVRALGVDVLAQLAILAAAISYACAGVYGRRFRAWGVTPMATATGQVTASSMLLLPIALLVDQPWALAAPSLQAIGAVAGIALLSTALAYILYFRILATAGATNLLLVTFLIPVSAIVLGVVVLDEVLSWNHVVGMACIGAGLGAIDGRIWAAIGKAKTLKPDGGNA